MEIILEGSNYENLIIEATEKLNTSKERIKVEILENKKNMFGTNIKIKATVIEINEECNPEDTKYQGISVIEFDYKEDGVYIRFGCMVTTNEIKEQMLNRGIENFDPYTINKEVGAGNFEKWIKIAESQSMKAVDCVISLKISKDLMKVIINITPPFNSADITESEIIKYLSDRNISYGINRENISELAYDRKYNQDIIIAVGMPPQNGTDGKIEYYFDTNTEKSFQVDEQGNVNFKELSLIKNVNKGDKLASLIPGNIGIDGINVLGMKVPAIEGRKIALPRGKNVDIDETGFSIIAGKPGEVKVIDGRINVFSVYEVKADVDPSTGNIRFNGKVVVSGNVLSGFEIEAEGDVEIYGVVEGAKITSGGNVVLHRGVLGAGVAEIICKGDLIAKFIENSKASVQGNITSDAIMQSHVLAGKKVEVTGKKGLIVGGSVRAGEEVRAKIIGSSMATVTEVEVGLNPDLRKKYDENKIELKVTAENMEKAKQAVDILTKIAKAGELPEDKKQMMSKSVQLKLQSAQKIEHLKKEQQELEQIFEDVNKGKIKVVDTIFPGCRIAIGSSMMYIKDPIKFCTFYRANAEIKLGVYEG